MYSTQTGFCVILLALVVAIPLCCDAFDADADIMFRLFTRNGSVSYTVLTAANEPPISETPFDANHPTRIFVHGFRSKQKTLNRYSDAFMKAGDYNLIVVDWTKGANVYNYYSAKGRVKHVARKLADLIELLVANGMKLSDLVIVGHSLGAHIAGCTAKLLTSGKPAIIIGLDPAGVGFDFFETSKRLSYSDADYVQVIHTDADKFGFSDPIGHADFYPNRGQDQPGCPEHNALTNLLEKCSHARAHHYFLESLVTDFTAIQCISYEEIQKSQCTFNNVTAKMGGNLTKDTPRPMGIFYLETNLGAPYVKPDYKTFNRVNLVVYE